MTESNVETTRTKRSSQAAKARAYAWSAMKVGAIQAEIAELPEEERATALAGLVALLREKT